MESTSMTITTYHQHYHSVVAVNDLRYHMMQRDSSRDTIDVVS